MDAVKHIVIVGAGFGGRDAARTLGLLLPRKEKYQVTLIDRHDYTLYTPMLTEVVGGVVEDRHVAVPLSKLPLRVRTVVGEVQGIDLRGKTVELAVAGGDIHHIHADQIVLALGATPKYHHLAGVQENSTTVKTLPDARRIYDQARRLVKQAAAEADENARNAMLTFVVAGGGYTGVETIAALNTLVRQTAAKYSTLRDARMRVLLVEPEKRIMAEVSEELADRTEKQLQADGVEVLTNVAVKQAEPGFVELANGERIATRMLIWDAGIEPNSLLQKIDVPKGKHGGVPVNRCLQVEGFEGVWAIGDCAEIPEGEHGTYAPTAQNATREGVLVARNIVRQIKGQSLQPFTYKPIGQLALISEYKGVAEIYGQKFFGFVAWAMWRVIYLAKLPDLLKRVGVLRDWLTLLFGRSLAAA